VANFLQGFILRSHFPLWVTISQGRGMPLDAKLRRRLEQVLRVVDDHKTQGPRLVDDALRLWNRCRRFIAMRLLGDEPDLEALELACYALQLPVRQAKAPTTGKFGRTNLKDRAEQAAELLVSFFDSEIDEDLLDRTARLLHEIPHRSPVPDEARVLADAVNLDDFGVVGLIQQMIQLVRIGDGVNQLAEGSEKREQYGYWEARLKDGFHFEPIRKIAAERLLHARQTATMLLAEMNEDQA
jgi:hypothetical protein